MTQQSSKQLQHRMTLAEIYRDYHDGLLTVKGALYYAISATCPPGKPVNFNVSDFLVQMGIHRGSYARSVAELVKEGRLDFPPNSVQSLRIPALPGTMQASYYSLTTSRSQICDRTQQICDNEPPKVAADTPSEAPSIYLPLLPLSLSTGERDENEGPDEYTEWLTKRASELPKPPTLLEEWLDRNRNKKSHRKQFLKYKEALMRASIPQPAAAAIFEFASESEQRLQTLRHWWDDGGAVRVRASIAAHPEWNLRIGQDGPEAIES